MISLSASALDTKILERLIARKVGAAVQGMVNSIYDGIYTIDHRSVKYHSRAPVLSGSFMSSWRINEGSIDGSVTMKPVGGGGSRYSKSESYFEYSNTYKPVYISNSVPYAQKLEDQGSPLHQAPWEIASHAYGVTLLRYKFKMNPTITPRRVGGFY